MAGRRLWLSVAVAGIVVGMDFIVAGHCGWSSWWIIVCGWSSFVAARRCGCKVVVVVGRIVVVGRRLWLFIVVVVRLGFWSMTIVTQ